MHAKERDAVLAPGNAACSGCGAILAIRLALDTIGRKMIVHFASGCMQVSVLGSGLFPYGAYPLKVPALHAAFDPSGAVVSGIEAALKVLGKKNDVQVVAVAGDGATADIGFQSLSGAIERGHDFIYICYDNEAYMNTGNQRSSTTMLYARTTTTPASKGKKGEIHLKGSLRKDMPRIIAAHGTPYVATASIAYPDDLIRKVKKATTIKGPRYIHIQTPCPIGWGFPENKTIEVARLAVLTGLWNLYEVEHGKLNVTLKVPERRSIREYLSLQKRFRHLTDTEIQEIEQLADKAWRELDQDNNDNHSNEFS